MSSFLNAGAVTNNLIMSLDMDNRVDGFLGAPCSNTISRASIGVYNNRPSDISVSLTATSETYRGAQIWRWVATPTTAAGVGWMTAGNNPGLGVVTGGGGGDANVYTSHSIFYKPTELMHSVPLYTNYSNISGWGAGALGSDTSEDMGDGWFRGVVNWFRSTAGSDGKYWAFNPLRATLNRPVTAYFAGPFRTNSNYAGHVPNFALEGRSNTQCLIDMSGNHAVDVGNMAYQDITGDLADFDGTTSRFIRGAYIGKYRPHSNSTSMTWEVIYKKTGGSNDQAIFGGKVGSGCSYFCNGGIYLSSNTFRANWYDNTNYNFMSSGFSPVLDQYHHVVVTFGPDQRFRIYVDGVLRATSNTTNNNYGGEQVIYNIGYNDKNTQGGGGASDHVTGRIPIVRQYYNKALSLDEVKQNYFAYKARFDLQ